MREKYIVLYEEYSQKMKGDIIMFKKFKEHCAKPITWGAYYKLCGICFAASIVTGAAMAIKTHMDIQNYNKALLKVNEQEETY